MAPKSKESQKTARLILTAIKNINMDGGVTLKNISSYIQEKFPQSRPPNESSLKRVIDKAIAFGAIKRDRKRYMLGSILDHVIQAKRRRRKAHKGKGKVSRRRRRRRRA